MTEFLCGSIYIRTNGALQGVAPGTTIKGHKHNFGHCSIFFNGRWRVKRGKETIERDGPFFLEIEADAFHEFVYLATNKEPGVSWCVFAHRTPDGEVVEKYTGWRTAHELKEKAVA